VRTLDTESIVGVAAARTLRGAKLKFIRIVSRRKFDRANVLEL
jgi:hypothetical protein